MDVHTPHARGALLSSSGLDPATPLPTFLARVEAEAGVAAGRGVLLAGFPPAPVEVRERGEGREKGE